MFRKFQYQVFIPARGGSKRFPRKNLVELDNIPLIIHSINYALNYFTGDKIWVNSDDDEILNVVKKYGVQTVKRPYNLADDLTPTVNVCQFQLAEFESSCVPCDAMILLQPTNPLRPKELLSDAIREFEFSERQSLATFTMSNKKTGKIKNNCFLPSNYIPGQRTQDIQKEYFENGLIYITKVESIKKGSIITKDVFPLIVDHIYAQVDIDYSEDLLFAEFLLKG